MRKKITAPLMVLLMFFLAGGSVLLRAQTKAERKLDYPVKKQNLIEVLKAKELADDVIIEVIDRNGVDFQLIDEVEAELKAAGATSQIIEAARRNYRISIGIANARATKLVQPVYPPDAKAEGIEGVVNVLVFINEAGQVVEVNALMGDARLRKAAEQAALASRFGPVIVSGKRMKAIGVVFYRFKLD